MSRKKKMQSAREMKDKRAKRMAIGGAVLLVAVLAFEVPKVMKHSGSSSTTPPAATTTTDVTGVTTPAATPSGTAAAATPTASTKLPNSDTAPRRAKSQLLSFSHFAGKDPFAQQVQATNGGLPSPPPTGATPAPNPSVVTAASVKSSGSAARQSSASRQLAVAGAVKINVNGRVETVRVGGSFPAANPLFKLVSVSRGGIRIGIANGSYTSGAHTVSLQPGRSLTLVDTADGIHYKIRFLSVS